MKKLLIMASLFWPQKNSGGPPVSIMNLVMSIKDQFDIYVISKNHEIGDDRPLPGIKEGWNQFDFGKAYYVPKGQHSFHNITNLIQQVQPDVIYQNSFFSLDDLLPVLVYKKGNPQVRVIVAPRGEFYPERIQRGKLKKQFYATAFRMSGLLKDVYFQGTGAEECQQEHDLLGIPNDHLINIQNIAVINLPGNEYVRKNAGELRLVYIARIHPTKNTLKAIRWLSDVKGKVIFDIYGPVEGEVYWSECLTAIENLPENISVSHKGMVEHNRVGEVISQYHGYYMPTNGENFGHSIVESLLVGRPVIISDQTPWTDVHGIGGFAYPLSQQAQFLNAIQQLCDMQQSEYDVLCANAKEYIAKKLNTEETIAQYIVAFNGE